jgi:tRNA A-37 threonylcarbamoyl transferase component Bud32
LKIASRISDLGPKIGVGRTAEVFGVEDSRALKLFRRDIDQSEIQNEISFTRLANASGIPTADVLECVTLEGRLGIVFSRISGESMLTRISQSPLEAAKLARKFAQLHCQIHSVEITSGPMFRDTLESQIRKVSNLGAATADQIITYMDSLPVSNLVLCHGDYHPDNLIISERGPVIIDWASARLGCAAADCARTSLLIAVGSTSHLNWPSSVITTVRGTFGRIYRRHYSKLMGSSTKEADLWLPVVAAARLAENINGEAEQLIKIVEKSFPN